jgi:hypothetical protein
MMMIIILNNNSKNNNNIIIVRYFQKITNSKFFTLRLKITNQLRIDLTRNQEKLILEIN